MKKNRVVAEKIDVKNFESCDGSRVDFELEKKYVYDDEGILIGKLRSDKGVEFYRTLLDYKNGNKIKKICRCVKYAPKTRNKMIAYEKEWETSRAQKKFFREKRIF